jgi:hypothetical protein
MNYRSLSAIGVIADKRRFLACDGLSAYDPSATLQSRIAARSSVKHKRRP